MRRQLCLTRPRREIHFADLGVRAQSTTPPFHRFGIHFITPSVCVLPRYRQVRYSTSPRRVQHPFKESLNLFHHGHSGVFVDCITARAVASCKCYRGATRYSPLSCSAAGTGKHGFVYLFSHKVLSCFLTALSITAVRLQDPRHGIRLCGQEQSLDHSIYTNRIDVALLHCTSCTSVMATPIQHCGGRHVTPFVRRFSGTERLVYCGHTRVVR